MDWSTDLQQMDWWIERLQPFQNHCVGSIIPAGFASVGRIFHPIELDGSDTERWADVAARHDRTVHPEMQLHAISTPRGEAPTYDGNRDMPYCWTGDLPERETGRLAHIVTRHTKTPDRCWFGVWDGYGNLHTGRWTKRFSRQGFSGQLPLPPEPGLLPAEVARTGSHGPNSREYYLMQGALADMDRARDLVGRQTPNLWWPEDRSWFVATEIDFCWTLVGGSAALVDELTSNSDLEVLHADYHHRGTVTADHVNT